MTRRTGKEPSSQPVRRSRSLRATSVAGTSRPRAKRPAEERWGRSRVDIVVKGRNVEVPDHYREHVADKLSKVERYDQKLIRADVELFHERNPRQSDKCQRVEITVMTRGPVVRAEACAKDFYTALDCAINKLDARLRRAADRRRVHRGRHAPVSVAAATAGLPTDLPTFEPPAGEETAEAAALVEHDHS